METSTIDSGLSDEQRLADRRVLLGATLRRCAADVRELPGRVALLGAADRIDAGDVSGELDLELHQLLREAQSASAVFERFGLQHPTGVVRLVDEALALIELQAESVDDIVRLVPRELCAAGDYDRAVLSRIVGSVWVPEAVHATDPSDDRGCLAGLRSGREMPLLSGTTEAEVVRRRVPALVRPAHSSAALRMDHEYVVAPVVAGDAVIGLLHAEASPSRRTLTELDRAVLRTFADGVGFAVERLVLLRRLQAQRRRLTEALAAAERAVDEMADATIRIAATRTSVRRAARPADVSFSKEGLTLREVEVLRLLVSGATNGQIADRLTVSETTVKSHVRHILRKLRVSNRAEAIARYLAARPNREA